MTKYDNPKWNHGQIVKGIQAMTDTKRLEFLMQFFRVDDVGDEDVCPGVVVDTDAVSEAFDYGQLAGETVTLIEGWHNPDMRRVIDKALAKAERKTT